MYGKEECIYCHRQKQLFGDSVQYLKIVDCSTSDGKEICSDLVKFQKIRNL